MEMQKEKDMRRFVRSEKGMCVYLEKENTLLGNATGQQ
jgi:hypothetical protein